MERNGQNEQPLAGGNVNVVLRVGDTVRRPRCANPVVHALLLYLQQQGFDGAPRYLGIDERGRDIYTYLAGEVVGDDYPNIPSYMWSDSVLQAVARLLRQYHDATRGLVGTLTAVPPILPGRDSDVVCHNDAALYNIVFRQGEPVALIDFDLAAPGPAVWDIAYALYTAVPLAGFAPGPDRTTAAYDPGLHAAGRKHRVSAFFQAYGMDVPADLKQVVIARISALCDTLERESAAGNAAFEKMVREGHLDHYRREIRFLDAHFGEWLEC